MTQPTPGPPAPPEANPSTEYTDIENIYWQIMAEQPATAEALADQWSKFSDKLAAASQAMTNVAKGLDNWESPEAKAAFEEKNDQAVSVIDDAVTTASSVSGALRDLSRVMTSGQGRMQDLYDEYQAEMTAYDNADAREQYSMRLDQQFETGEVFLADGNRRARFKAYWDWRAMQLADEIGATYAEANGKLLYAIFLHKPPLDYVYHPGGMGMPFQLPGGGPGATPPPPGTSAPIALLSAEDPTLGTDPPGTQPPGTEPPGTQPPGTQPPGTQPPGTQPPGTQPPGTQPPGTQPPGTQPPGTQPPGTQPPGTQPPGTQPPGTQPPGTQPPAFLPPPVVTPGLIGPTVPGVPPGALPPPGLAPPGTPGIGPTTPPGVIGPSTTPVNSSALPPGTLTPPGTPPGTLPPGTRPPGTLPPGTPGARPPGTSPPGTPRQPQQRGGQPGTSAPGPDGTAASMPPGTGMMPPGTGMPPGTRGMPPGTPPGGRQDRLGAPPPGAGTPTTEVPEAFLPPAGMNPPVLGDPSQRRQRPGGITEAPRPPRSGIRLGGGTPPILSNRRFTGPRPTYTQQREADRQARRERIERLREVLKSDLTRDLPASTSAVLEGRLPATGGETGQAVEVPAALRGLRRATRDQHARPVPPADQATRRLVTEPPGPATGTTWEVDTPGGPVVAADQPSRRRAEPAPHALGGNG